MEGQRNGERPNTPWENDLEYWMGVLGECDEQQKIARRFEDPSKKQCP